MTAEELDARRLRRIVLIVALINFGYFFVEFTVALAAGSVSLLADSVDFLEDTTVNLLVFIALGWPLARRAMLGKDGPGYLGARVPGRMESDPAIRRPASP